MIVYRNEWVAAISWAVTNVCSPYPDQGTGGQVETPFKTRYAVARMHAFILRPRMESGCSWGPAALNAALKDLPHQMLHKLGVQPMLAEANMHPRASNARYFTETGWHMAAVMENNGTSWWLKDLAPASGVDLGNYLLAKCIYAGNLGRLPIPRSCLETLKAALQATRDRRPGRSKYQLGSTLSLAFLAVVCGAEKPCEIAEHSRRLRSGQADALDLPAADEIGRRTPGTVAFSRLYLYVDVREVVRIVDQWLRDHLDELPNALDPDAEFMSTKLAVLTRIFQVPSLLRKRPRKTGIRRPRNDKE